MKNFFSINVNTEELDFEKFIIKKADKTLVEKLQNQNDTIQKGYTKAHLPAILNILSYIAVFYSIIFACGIFIRFLESNLGEWLKNNPVFYITGLI